MAEIDNTIALGVKPQPQQDIIGPITSLAQLQYLQAHGALENAQAQFQQGKLGALHNYGQMVNDGTAPEDAITKSSLGAYDPAGANAMLGNIGTARTLKANQAYATSGDPRDMAIAGPEAQSKAITASVDQQGYQQGIQIAKMGNDLAMQRLGLAGQIAGGVLSMGDVNGAMPQGGLPQQIRADAVNKALQAGLINKQQAVQESQMSDGDFWNIAKSWAGAAQGAKDFAETSGQAKGRQTAAETANKPEKMSPGESLVVPNSATLPASGGGDAQPRGMSRVGGTTPEYYHAALSGGDTSSALRASEGLRTGAYYDVNHWRTGYGSDTVTLADGTVKPVTATTRITPEDAERDLQRRVPIASALAQKQVGDAWSGYGPGAQSAMTSMVYNYGRLPSDVAQAAASGDSQTLASAIAKHASDSSGANYARRIAEARAVLGGVGQSNGAVNNGIVGNASPETLTQAAAGMPVPPLPARTGAQGGNPLAPTPPAQLGVAPVVNSPTQPGVTTLVPGMSLQDKAAAEATGKGMADAQVAQYAKAKGDYDAANTAQMKLGELMTSLDDMPKSGLLTPGSGATERVGFAKLINTALQAAGSSPMFPPDQISAAENSQKITGNLGFDLSRTLGSKEAASITEQAIKLNPGIENTPFGARVVAGAINAGLQRQRDFYQFLSENRNAPDADLKFNKEHPPAQYVKESQAVARVPSQAIKMLQANPALADKFDAKYGSGLSRYFAGS